jgi:hypothetical protein
MADIIGTDEGWQAVQNILDGPDEPIDPNTKRPFGDHGSANAAIECALDTSNHDHDSMNQICFLEAWRDGSAYEGWPEYYDWLRKKDM